KPARTIGKSWLSATDLNSADNASFAASGSGNTRNAQSPAIDCNCPDGTIDVRISSQKPSTRLAAASSPWVSVNAVYPAMSTKQNVASMLVPELILGVTLVTIEAT